MVLTICLTVAVCIVILSFTAIRIAILNTEYSDPSDRIAQRLDAIFTSELKYEDKVALCQAALKTIEED